MICLTLRERQRLQKVPHAFQNQILGLDKDRRWKPLFQKPESTHASATMAAAAAEAETKAETEPVAVEKFLLTLESRVLATWFSITQCFDILWSVETY